MPKKPSRTIATVNSLPSPEAGPRRMGDAVVNVDAVYHVPSIKPHGDGPWTMEAEKVAWTDAATGLQCIIRRDRKKGHLCGYVAVPKSHPMYGWDEVAMRGVGIRAHGGLNYADECQHHEHESLSVCHPTAADRAVMRAMAERNAAHWRQAREDELWWIGFSCDQVYDRLPKPDWNGNAANAVAGTFEAEYRDEGYVRRQCESLAAQLRAVADGRPLPEPEEAPPLGLDPCEGAAR
jgi:hypothetical protein